MMEDVCTWSTPVRKLRLEKLVKIASGRKYVRVILTDNVDIGYSSGNNIYVTVNPIPNVIYPGMSDDLWMLLIQRAVAMHELGHVLWTNFNRFNQTKELLGTKYGALALHIFREIFNILEDGRVDRAIEKEFPGAGFYIRKLRQNNAKIMMNKLENGQFPKDRLTNPLIQYYSFIYDTYVYDSGAFTWFIKNGFLHPITLELISQTMEDLNDAFAERDPKKFVYKCANITKKVLKILDDKGLIQNIGIFSFTTNIGISDRGSGSSSRHLPEITNLPDPQKTMDEINNLLEQTKSKGKGEEEQIDNDGGECQEKSGGRWDTNDEEIGSDGDKDIQTEGQGGDLEDTEDIDNIGTSSDSEEHGEIESEGEEDEEEELDQEEFGYSLISDDEDESVGSILDKEELEELQDELSKFASDEEELEKLRELSIELSNEIREISNGFRSHGSGEFEGRVIFTKPNYTAFRQFSEDRIRSVGSIVASGLLTILRERTKSHYKGGYKRGRLHTKSIWKVAKNPPDYRVFKRKEREKELNYQCFILLDRSVSMMGDPIYKAEYATLVLCYALEKVGIQTEVIGFNSTGVYLHKLLDEKFEYAKYKISQLYAIGTTPTHEALRVVKARIRKLARKNPFIIVVTDGVPDRRQDTIEEIKTCPFPVIGVTINTSSRSVWDEIYHANVYVTSVNDLLPALTQLVKKLMF